MNEKFLKPVFGERESNIAKSYRSKKEIERGSFIKFMHLLKEFQNSGLIKKTTQN